MLHQALCSVVCHCHGLASCCERVQQSSMHRLFNVGLGESTWRVAVSELAFATYVEHICRRRRIYTATASVNTFATGQSFHRITIAALLPSSTSFAGSTMITWLPIGLLPLCECGSAVSTYMSFERIPLCVGVSTDTSGTRNAKGLDPVMHACVVRLSCKHGVYRTNALRAGQPRLGHQAHPLLPFVSFSPRSCIRQMEQAVVHMEDLARRFRAIRYQSSPRRW
jgi:hypothetical protein